jgi:two-component system, OmpR family, copper resistance phosphate regulon response regulator CusR
MKILLVEDEIKVSNFIKKGLEEQGYSIDVAYDGYSGISKWQNGLYDLIILDVVLPHHNGLEICSEIRSKDKSVPILMLTALSSTQDKINGFNCGADDYLIKPFQFQEFQARIQALLRRKNLEISTESKLSIDNLTVELNSKVVHRGEHLIQLTSREFHLLVFLLRNRGKVLSRIDIAEKIWEQSFDSGSNVIDVYINYLRKKVDLENEKKLIHTVIGMGYVIRE